MSGALLSICGAGAPAVATASSPGSLAWNDLYGVDTAATQTLPLTGLTGAATLAASYSGGGTLGYVLNGNPSRYTGAFVVHPGDQLAWFMTIQPAGGASVAGAVTVTNVSGGGVLDSFNYVLNSSRGAIP